MDLDLPFPVGIALVAGALLPVLLVVLGHGPWKVAAPGRRFLVAAALLGSMAGVGVLLVPCSGCDLVAALLILAGATLVVFVFWTLVAWGFTLTMLRALAAADHALTEEEWIAAVTGGRNLTAFCTDRLSVLERFGCAARVGERVVLTRVTGRRTARLAIACRRLFGLTP